MAATYEIAPLWVPYYAELAPERRLEILEALTADNRDFRRQLYRERYQDPKRPDCVVDNWLWKCLYLPGLYRRGGGFFKGAARQEVLAALRELHLDRPEALTDDERTVLYWEFRNTARRYLSTCRSDGYGSSFFGMRRATEDEKRLRAREDIWMMSQGLAQAYQLEENMALWCEALHDELAAFASDSAK